MVDLHHNPSLVLAVEVVGDPRNLLAVNLVGAACE
jgi:hypothetical protein